MTPVNPSELTDQALMEKAKKQKSSVLLFRIMMCLVMGIAIWSATHKGSFLIACLPFLVISSFIKSENNYKAVLTEIEARKL